MPFNSIHFLFFFPVIVVAYSWTPAKFRWLLLLTGSYYFCAGRRPEQLIVILLTTTIGYFTAARMTVSSQQARRAYLYFGLIANLGLLFIFKYFNFFGNTLNSLLGALNLSYQLPHISVLLPVAISFYTFKVLSYTMDVYRGEWAAEKHLGKFALFVSFWPQLVSGPIERAGRLLPQLNHLQATDYQRLRQGLIRMGWGFFKKLVIADRLAIYVNTVYGKPSEQSGWAVVLATVFFAFQIYCDFSGYTDIAIGAARVFGVSSIENFKNPYFAISVSDFWRRWHISLSTWFRDYVYIPLGGNRVSSPRWIFNILVTFLISGLWHGASWTFVIWGGLHGVLLILERFARLNQAPKGWLAFVRRGITFGAVTFAWLFFRANSLEDALVLIRQLGHPGTFRDALAVTGWPNVLIGLVVIVALMLHERILGERAIEDVVLHQRLVVRWSYYTGLMFFTLWLGVFTSNQFIYAQF